MKCGFSNLSVFAEIDSIDSAGTVTLKILFSSKSLEQESYYTTISHTDMKSICTNALPFEGNLVFITGFRIASIENKITEHYHLGSKRSISCMDSPSIISKMLIIETMKNASGGKAKLVNVNYLPCLSRSPSLLQLKPSLGIPLQSFQIIQAKVLAVKEIAAIETDINNRLFSVSSYILLLKYHIINI
jgi:hypothetical protein